MRKKILFLVPYPLAKAPSQRFRVEAFLPILHEAGLTFSVYPFIGNRTWNVLYRRGAIFLKTWGFISGFLKRWVVIILKVPRCDYVFIHREAAPIGPPVFEWIVARLLRKKIIYDFDDAIWIPNTSAANSFMNWFKAFWKVRYICKLAFTITPGNDFLCNYALQFNTRVVKIPTSIDSDKYRPLPNISSGRRLNIGWTGSHSTLRYLDAIVPIINQLREEFDFDFVVIADMDPSLPIRNSRFIQWNAVTEADDLLAIDIGVMPLVADAWSEGKCGFKLIQYFACGIPAVASPVGVNKKIVEHGVNGFLCTTDDEWKQSLRSLLRDESLRNRLGAAGRQKVTDQYSLQSQSSKFLELFQASNTDEA